MIIASDNDELMKAMLFSALASPIRPIMIVPKEPYPELIMKWRKLLKSMDIDFQQIDDHFVTPEKDVLLCQPVFFKAEVLKVARSSIVLIELVKRKEKHDIFGGMPSVKGRLDIKYLGYELPHIILGASDPFNDRYDVNNESQVLWYNSAELYDSLSLLHSSDMIEGFIGEINDTKRFQDRLLQNGLVLGSRSKLVQFMGVNLDLFQNK